MPSQWKYLPRTLDIYALDPFAKVLDASADVVVTAADFEDAFRQLPELLLAISEARKIQLRSLLQIPAAKKKRASNASQPGKIIQSESPSSSSQPDALDLATAAFTCRKRCSVPFLFGWDDIAQHHCKSDLDTFDISDLLSWWQHAIRFAQAPGPPKIDFSADLSKIAGAVIQAVGLDDRVATVSDMDAKDLRFGCSACPPERYRGCSWMKFGYNWRDFVRVLPLGFSFSFLFFFNSNVISSRLYIIIQHTACICSHRTTSPCSPQMTWNKSKKAK